MPKIGGPKKGESSTNHYYRLATAAGDGDGDGSAPGSLQASDTMPPSAPPARGSFSSDWHGEATHSLWVGYALWLFGFLGAHRFYYGKPVTGTIWFFTLGLLFIGWIIDFFLMPRLQREAEIQSTPGPIDHTIAWLLLTFLGVFGAHRFYMGKWLTGLVYALTGGLIGVGVLYDFWTLNGQVSERNSEYAGW